MTRRLRVLDPDRADEWAAHSSAAGAVRSRRHLILDADKTLSVDDAIAAVGTFDRLPRTWAAYPRARFFSSRRRERDTLRARI